MKPPNCNGNQLETGNGGHGVPERFESKCKVPGGENRGLTRMDADKRKPLPLTLITFGVIACNQRLSAFIRGSKPRFIGISKQRA